LGTRGAVYVEFLIAFLPMLIFFECLVQLAGLYTAKLVTLHAATTAARAAVVVLHDDPADYGDVAVGQVEGKRKDDIEKAAAIPLRAVKSIIAVKVKFPSTPGGDDSRESFERDELVRVRVEATYLCSVPFASRLVCNWLTRTITLKAEAALPNNGADYEY
jgi:hypothetical protein